MSGGDWGEVPFAGAPGAFRYRYGATALPTIFIRAPNRYRKLLVDPAIAKPHRDPWGLDLSMIDESQAAIEKQRAEFPDIDAIPIGFQALLDNDLAIAWEPKGMRK